MGVGLGGDGSGGSLGGVDVKVWSLRMIGGVVEAWFGLSALGQKVCSRTE